MEGIQTMTNGCALLKNSYKRQLKKKRKSKEKEIKWLGKEEDSKRKSSDDNTWENKEDNSLEYQNVSMIDEAEGEHEEEELEWWEK